MKAAARKLRANFEDIERQNRGESGRRREDDVREFLAQHLPKKLGVASGEIVDSTGGCSPQMDVIICDALNTPLFDSSPSSILVPVEGVYAVIEVASNLTGPKLLADAKKIRQAKELNKAAFLNASYPTRFHYYGRDWDHFPMHGFIFAYRGSNMRLLGEALTALEAETPLEHRVDCFYVLSEGICLSWEGTHWGTAPWATSTRMPVHDSFGDSGVLLLWFLRAIMDPLAGAAVNHIGLGPYSSFP